MIRSLILVVAAVFFLSRCSVCWAAGTEARVAIWNEVATEIGAGPEVSKDLWITTGDLKRVAKLELKPEGVCSDKACYPIPESRKPKIIEQRAGTTWFNLSEFARFLKQPVAHDAKHAVWLFGPRPQQQNVFLDSLQAPKFTLPDLKGKQHSLSDFKGKKILLITWASW